MKLQLVQENGIYILSVTGPVDDQGALVLQAGVTKLYKNGHNRVVLELLNPREVSAKAFKVFQDLHALARELMGDLVLVAAGTKHPQIPCFPARAAALSHFKGAKTPAMPAAVPVSGDPEIRPNMSASELIALVERRNVMIKDLRTQLQSSLPGGVDPTFQQNERLKRDNELLREKLDELINGLRIPRSAKAYDDKILQLEAEVIRLSEQLKPEKMK